MFMGIRDAPVRVEITHIHTCKLHSRNHSYWHRAPDPSDDNKVWLMLIYPAGVKVTEDRHEKLTCMQTSCFVTGSASGLDRDTNSIRIFELSNVLSTMQTMK